MKRLIGALVLILLLAAAGFAETAAQAGNREGLEAYGRGEFREAVTRFQQADVDAPDNPVIIFNTAAAQYRLGNYSEALDLFVKAEQTTDDDRLDLDCKYNRGNTCFKLAEQVLEKDLKQGIEQFGQAVAAYRAVLDIDPAHADARHNLMVVKLILKDLQDRLKKEQEKQKDDQQDKQKTLPERIAELLKRQMAEKAETAAVANRDAAAENMELVRSLGRSLANHVQNNRWDAALKEADSLGQALQPLLANAADQGFMADEERRKEVAAFLQSAGELDPLVASLKTGLNAANSAASSAMLGKVRDTLEQVFSGIKGLYDDAFDKRNLLSPAQENLRNDTEALTAEVAGALDQAAQAGSQPGAGMDQQQVYLLKDVRGLLEGAAGEQDRAAGQLKAEHFPEAVPPQLQAVQKLKEALEKFKQENQDQQQDQQKDQQQDQQQQQAQSIQEILDKEKQDRKDLQEAQRRMRARVKDEEKDW